MKANLSNLTRKDGSAQNFANLVLLEVRVQGLY